MIIQFRLDVNNFVVVLDVDIRAALMCATMNTCVT